MPLHRRPAPVDIGRAQAEPPSVRVREPEPEAVVGDVLRAALEGQRPGAFPAPRPAHRVERVRAAELRGHPDDRATRVPRRRRRRTRLSRFLGRRSAATGGGPRTSPRGGGRRSGPATRTTACRGCRGVRGRRAYRRPRPRRAAAACSCLGAGPARHARPSCACRRSWCGGAR
ncbi:hypothetical protein PVAP13_9KG422236 [Panicum virgatum]|uniref:Uncharacterized protein n=1 Tax=Panicum virgatum TaxID=38727 RepID=A0A8T0NAU4_PANVG|nr:hypothetical protein PVAP13_9KG422236 [Panicum virgatum]